MGIRLFPDETIYKTPNEIIIKHGDFVDDIPDNDSLKSVGSGSSAVAEDEEGADVSSTILKDTKIIDTTKVQTTIMSGTDEKTYLITFSGKMSTSDELFQRFLVVHVIQQRIYR